MVISYCSNPFLIYVIYCISYMYIKRRYGMIANEVTIHQRSKEMDAMYVVYIQCVNPYT